LTAHPKRSTAPHWRDWRKLPVSKGPYSLCNDLTVLDRAGRAVCTMGVPEDAPTRQNRRDAAAILALDDLTAALAALIKIRPANWADGDDPEQTEAWKRAKAALAKSEGKDA
jgi:hypothetical protein